MIFFHGRHSFQHALHKRLNLQVATLAQHPHSRGSLSSFIFQYLEVATEMIQQNPNLNLSEEHNHSIRHQSVSPQTKNPHPHYTIPLLMQRPYYTVQCVINQATFF